MGPNITEDCSETTTQNLSNEIKIKIKRDNCSENFNVVRDKAYNRPLGKATHRYPTRNVIQQVEKKQIIEKITKMNEPLKNENNPPFLLNAIIDEETGEVDKKELINGIEVLETKVNAITCPKNRKPSSSSLRIRHAT